MSVEQKILMFCRIQNLHISQTSLVTNFNSNSFCRIQNLHISQTTSKSTGAFPRFVEFKIYISLKQGNDGKTVYVVL